MFARKNRFSFRKGAPKKYFQTPFFTIRYDNSAKSGLEVAVVVGKKVDKRATVRNKTKRKIVAFVKRSVSTGTNFRLVIYAKKQIKTEEFESIEKDLEQAFNKLNIK